MIELTDNYSSDYLGPNFITINAMKFDVSSDNNDITLLAEEVISLLHHHKKTKIAFNVISEGLPFKQLNISHKLIRYLIEYCHIYNIYDFKIISGGVPCAENLSLYKSHCKTFNWIEVPIVFINFWETTRHLLMSFYKNEYDQIDITPRVKPKKFVCYNRSIKMHRMYITTETINRNLLDKAYFSNYFTLEKDGFNLGSAHEYLPTKYKSIIDTVSAHKNIFPIDLGLVNYVQDDSIPDRTHGLDKLDIEHLNNSYFGVITETKYFHDDLDPNKNNLMNDVTLNCFFFTEKTYKFIHGKLPFILVGLTGSLEILKNMGYKTFHPFIDESYDKISNDEERLDAIMDEIERLCNLSDTDMLEWQRNLTPILEHNFNILFESGQKIFTNLPII